MSAFVLDKRLEGDSVPLAELPLSAVRRQLFVKDVKVQDGSIRSASVLTVAYVPVPAFDVPEYQSSRALVWFDCKQERYEQRGIARYASMNGGGTPTSADAEKVRRRPKRARRCRIGSPPQVRPARAIHPLECRRLHRPAVISRKPSPRPFVQEPCLGGSIT